MDIINVPYVKVTIGKYGDKTADTFISGDNKLKDISVTLAEGRSLSNCSFSIYDPTRTYVDKYFNYIESVQGLDPIAALKEDSNNSSSSSTLVNSDNSYDDDSRPGKLIYAQTKASVYDPFKGGINGNPAGGAYKNEVPRTERLPNGNIDWNNGFYAAMKSRTYKLGLMRVTNLANNKSVVVKVVDRGPFEPGREIDLTRKAWNQIASENQQYPPGDVIDVKIEWLQDGKGVETQTNKQQTANTENRLSNLENTTIQVNNAVNNASLSVENASKPSVTKPVSQNTLAGSQITVELGYDDSPVVAYSFIHTSLTYNLDSPDLLEFKGVAANWVLTQRVKNTVYTNMTFKKIASRICESYGLILDMDDEGPKYEYFPQRATSDYETLLIEARRLGYRVYTKGLTLSIKSRENLTSNKDTFTQIYGEGLGLTFTVEHSASSGSGGARASEQHINSKTGERKFFIDEKSGKATQQINENLVGTGSSDNLSITGSDLATVTPIVSGTANPADYQRKEDEMRVKGIIASTSFPTTISSLTLDPDTPYRTIGISSFLDRYWVIDSVTHSLSDGSLKTSLNIYSPLKNKRPPETKPGGSSSLAPVDNSQISGEAFDPSTPKFSIPLSGTVTSLFGSRQGRNHNGVDISSVGGTGPGSKIYASASGTVTVAKTGYNGGYGTMVDINHGGGGWTTRYTHLYSLSVSPGQTVYKGQQIGVEGNTGASRGTHLHFEIRKNGSPLNPSRFIKSLGVKNSRVRQGN